MSTLTLKILACVAMLADHIGFLGFLGAPISMVLRAFGRIAFPIYCYLLAFGFRKTHNKYLYMARLAVFALVSELPFNYCFFGNVTFEFKNVFFTLLLGLASITVYDFLASGRGTALRVLAIIPVVLFALAAKWLETDYSWFGVVLIFLFYIAGESKVAAATACVLFGARNVLADLIVAMAAGFAGLEISTWDWMAMCSVAAALPILLCNGSRGACPHSRAGRLAVKYAFYAFYPLHLTVLGLVARGLM